MDDNNYMNNDNRSSGTPDNTGVFGQSSETANGSDTYSQPQDTYNQPTDTYNQSVSQQESGNAYAYGQSSDQTGSTDGYVNNPVMQIRVHTIRIQMPRVHTTRIQMPRAHTTRTHMLRAHLISQLTDRRSMASSQTDRVATIRLHTDRQPTISHSMELIHTTSRQRTAMALV